MGSLGSEMGIGHHKGIITVHVTGINTLIRDFKRIRFTMPKVVNNLTKEYADAIVLYAKHNVETRSVYDPVDYGLNKLMHGAHPQGTLRDSITVLSSENVEGGTKLTVGIEPSSHAREYAGTVEFGRKKGKEITPNYYNFMRFAWKKYLKVTKWTEKGITKTRFDRVIYRRKIKQGAQRPMYYMRDAVIQATNERRGIIDKRILDNLRK